MNFVDPSSWKYVTTRPLEVNRSIVLLTALFCGVYTITLLIIPIASMYICTYIYSTLLVLRGRFVPLPLVGYRTF